MSDYEFIDNRDGRTMGAALTTFLADIAEPIPLDIATAFFTPAGFSTIGAHLDKLTQVRLLIGAEFPTEAALDRRQPGDPPPGVVMRQRVTRALGELDKGLRAERDHMPFTREVAGSLKMAAAHVRSGKIVARRYEKNFLHAKAYIAGGAGRTYFAGSSNLTHAGLHQNLELNLARRDADSYDDACRWFTDLWDEAVDLDLEAFFAAPFETYTPYEIFLRILYQLYGSDTEAEANDDGLPLTTFQRHGVWRAKRLLEERGGVIIADEVGLGKTFIAGELIKMFTDNRQRVLLICPAALRDSTWDEFTNRFMIPIECVSFEELANDQQLHHPVLRPYATQRHLKNQLNEYALIVVDEAHNYRNPDTPARAAAMRHLLYGPRKDLVLLTATPVNNSLWDLFHLLRFFLRQDAQLADRGILSLRERFEEAMRQDPHDLDPDILYPILDATTVKRTRAFVKRHYEGETISGPDGRPLEIVFPKPTAITVRYDIEEIAPELFDRVADALDPAGEDPLLFARYATAEYLLGGGDEDEVRQAHAATALLRSGVLKRFESSIEAFRRTLAKMAAEHRVFLEALGHGKVITTQFLREISGEDSALEDMLDELHDLTEESSLFDAAKLKDDVEHDLAILDDLCARCAAIGAARDPKIEALRQSLVDIVHQAERDAIDEADAAQKRKLLIFSYFADTVDYVAEEVRRLCEADPILRCYSGRLAAVAGAGKKGFDDRERAVFGFAPISSKAPPGTDDRYDLLIATDVLAEGMNLQQARHIINFDMPWNPMRLVQRHGRIDRIGSPHARVFLRTIFPADRLEQLLDLEGRIRLKLAQAAATIGVGVAPIEGAQGGAQVFAETREEIERLYAENPELFENRSAGAAQTAEEYRMRLRAALAEDHDRIAKLPWKAGSGMMRGERQGFIFCAQVGERTYLRFIPCDDNWRVLNDQPIMTEVGSCLRLAACETDEPRVLDAAAEEAVFDAWPIAQRSIHEAWTFETDPINLQPPIRPLNQRVADFLRRSPPADITDQRLSEVLNILESPWPRREEAELRRLFGGDEGNDAERSRKLVEFIVGTGIEPFIAPAPLPPIALEDVDLVVWLALTTVPSNARQA